MDKVLNKNILGIGHSHLSALRGGYNRGYKRVGKQPPFAFSIIRLFDDEFLPNIVQEDGGAEKLNPAIVRKFKARVRRDQPDVLVSCIMGNEHNSIALLNHPRRFDFFLPSRPDLPADESAEVLPFDLVADLIRHEYRPLMVYFSTLAPLSGCPFVHVPPPPPIPDSDFILAHPQKFEKLLNKFGVSPKFFRMKMWLLTCDVVKSMCDEAGVIFYAIPKSLHDADGFLARPFWKEDPTHANFEYGKNILEDIAGRPLGGTRDGEET